LYRIVSQDYFAMRTNPRSNLMAAVAASLIRHGKAASVDLSWYAPNATSINNLTQVMTGSDIYGWVYNNSQVPADEYGIYNWCNMPHVRKTEYKVPSSEYKLQYVEVVSLLVPIEGLKLTGIRRSTDITNEQSTLRTLSQLNHIHGTVMMKSCFIMDNRSLAINPRQRIGKVISHPQILSSQLDF
jgi:hypothetical protein